MLLGSIRSLSIRGLEEYLWSGSVGPIVSGEPGQLFPVAKRFFSSRLAWTPHLWLGCCALRDSGSSCSDLLTVRRRRGSGNKWREVGGGRWKIGEKSGGEGGLLSDGEKEEKKICLSSLAFRLSSLPTSSNSSSSSSSIPRVCVCERASLRTRVCNHSA